MAVKTKGATKENGSATASECQLGGLTCQEQDKKGSSASNLSFAGQSLLRDFKLIDDGRLYIEFKNKSPKPIHFGVMIPSMKG